MNVRRPHSTVKRWNGQFTIIIKYDMHFESEWFHLDTPASDIWPNGTILLARICPPLNHRLFSFPYAFSHQFRSISSLPNVHLRVARHPFFIRFRIMRNLDMDGLGCWPNQTVIWWFGQKVSLHKVKPLYSFRLCSSSFRPFARLFTANAEFLCAKKKKSNKNYIFVRMFWSIPSYHRVRCHFQILPAFLLLSWPRQADLPTHIAFNASNIPSNFFCWPNFVLYRLSFQKIMQNVVKLFDKGFFHSLDGFQIRSFSTESIQHNGLKVLRGHICGSKFCVEDATRMNIFILRSGRECVRSVRPLFALFTCSSSFFLSSFLRCDGRTKTMDIVFLGF